MNKKTLTAKTEISVRFSEVDSLGIVWHGNYVKYFEDGREAFGKKYKINNLDILKHGFIAPVVKMNCNFKNSLKYGDKAIVETQFVDCEAAKLILQYKIYRSSNKEIITTAETEQVFLNDKGELNLTIPDFFAKWKNKWLYCIVSIINGKSHMYDRTKA